MRRVFQFCAVTLLLASATLQASPLLDFSGGFVGSDSSLNYNGPAFIAGSRARIINGGNLEVGSVWSKNQVNIRGFSCEFTFQVTSPSEAGFTFTIQRAGNTVSGYPFEAMGAYPTTPSCTLKFDIWPSVSTTGLYTSGQFPGDDPPASIDMAPSGIDLHSEHVFDVQLTYDGVTLHETVRDTSTNATFTQDYTIDLAGTVGGNDAYVGFTSSSGSGLSCIPEIITWMYSVVPTSYLVDFTAFPESLQLYPRNRVTNTAVVPVGGTESLGGFNQAVLRLYRNGVQIGGDLVQNLVYSGGQAPFSFSPTITAELAHYDVELFLRDNANQLVSVQRTNDIVAGDVIVVQGQSNAVAKEVTGSSAAYISPFVRTLGLESFWPPASTSFGSWMVATGDGAINEEDPGDVGQWGLVMANQIMTANNVPVAVMNAAFGGSPISFFFRNDAQPDDASTNYGRLLQRLERAGVDDAVRTILFYQGESDDNDGPGWQSGFAKIRGAWFQDYSSLEKLYVFQVRECPCGPVTRFDVDLRNRQRLSADMFPDVSVISSNGLDGHNGCHFSFSGGGYEQLGLNVARMVQRDLYQGANLPNTDPPNPAYAVLTGANQDLIRLPLRNRSDAITFDPGAINDFAIVGSSVSIVNGTVTNGVIELALSGNAAGATSVVYTGHTGPASGNWVANANGIGLLSFIETVRTDHTPPVITLLGSNPVLLNLGDTYVEPGATATDNLDGNLTSSIVIDSSAVNTSVRGNYNVTYNVSDVAGNAAPQLTRTVHVNAQPVANSQFISTNKNTAVGVTLTASDADGDTLTYSIVTSPAHGTLSGTIPNLTYTPATNYTGPDSFTFKANDGMADSNTATISLSVDLSNHPPVANAQSVTTNEDTAKGITLTASDVDGDMLTFSVVTSPAHGALSGSAPNLTYTPASNYNGPDSFTFKANDGTDDSNTATVSITVTAVNDPPVANAQSVTTNQDTAKGITLTASDVDGDALNYSIVTNPAHGSLTGTAPNLTYTPAAGYHGSDSFTFKANDGTVDSNTATVSITVAAVNHAPVANAQSVTTNEDTAKAITLTASDSDGDALTYSVVTGPAHGVLSGTAPNLTYTPAANYNGPDSFTFKANDGTVDSNTATVSITVSAVNDAPVANAQSVTTNEDTAKGITLTATDVDGDPLTYSVVTGPAHGVLSGTAPNVTYTPAANYNGPDSFTFKANDGTVDSNTATVSITVTAVNDAPVANAQSVTTNEDTAKAITLTATDVDGDTLTYSVVTGPAHGALSGTAPNVTYTPAANYNGPDSFTFRANDGTVNSNTATVSITVSAVNDPPVANAQSVTTNEDTAKAVTLTASDADGDTLAYSVVTGPAHGVLSGTAPNLTYTPAANYNGPDSFTFKANDGTVDSNTATISITVTAVNDPPVADAQSVTTNEDTAKAITLTASDVDGDTLTYSVVTGPAHGALSGTAPNVTYTPAANYNGPDSFTFRANDGTVNSNTATVSITVTAVNDAPVANAQSVTTDQDTAKAITVTASDVDGDTLTYSIVTNPAHGSLTGTAPNLTYTPAAGYHGSDSFAFKANDGTVDSNTATVSITVVAANNPPVADAQSVTTNEDTAKAITLTASDVDGDTLTYSVVTVPSHGALSGTAPNVTYTPAANYNGPDSFTFKANDGKADSNTATVSITVAAVNDPPVANAQSVTTNEDTAKGITLTASDVDGDTLTYSVVTGPAHGVLSGTAPNLTYTPATNYNGPDSFTFRANDGTVNSNTATVSITVTAVNDAPVANAQSVTTNEDTAKAITLTASDVDGDTLIFSVVTGPAHGVLSGTPPNVTYTPASNYNGPDSFTFKANDGAIDSNTATISITVTAVNDAPVADAQSVQVDQDTPEAITLTASDVDGDPLTFSVVTGPSHGSLSGTPPNLTYTPVTGYHASDSFTFKANDGTVDSNTATVSIMVKHSTNHAPVADPQAVTTNEDTAKAITLTASDVDGDPLTYSVVTGPAHGALSGTVPNLTYTPAPNYKGPDSFTFKANDGAVDSNTATISITVTAVNDPPVANAQAVTTNEDTAKAITLTASDVDGDTLTYSVVTGPAHGALSGTAPNLTYTPAANYNGPDSFTFKANDGMADSNTATISINVTAVNDPPVANAQAVTTNEDTAKAVTLTASDVDGDALTYSVVTGPTHGVLSGTAPNLTYTPAANYHGPDSFTFKANDGAVDSNTATVSITVTAVNDPPVADAQSVTTNENVAKAITLTASDVDGDTLTFGVVAGPAHGALSGTAPNVTYTPASNYSGPDSFMFKANDGTVDSNTATISITVNSVNHAPVADAQSVTTNQDTAKAITLTASDSDGDTLTYSVVTGAAHGTLSGTAPNVTYTPTAGYHGPDSFTFKANDGTADSNTATVSITVAAVNHPPTANAQSVTTNEDTAKGITLTASDVDGDTLTYSVVTGPAHGVLSGTAPNLTYTPAANYNGPDSFTFKANDGTVDSNTATVSITVTAVNDPPVANAQSVTTNEDTAKGITLTASDVDGDTLAYSVVAGPAHGVLSGTAPNLTYTPAANYNGPDSFTFKANDGASNSNTATVSITVTAVNDPPVADAQAVTTNQDTAKAIILTASDVDGDTLSYSTVTGPAHGALSGTPPNVTYTPTAAYHGSDSFTFKANDGTVDSNTATVSITVSAVNHAPVADAQSVSTNQDTAKGITLTASDVDGDTLTYSVVTGPAHGTLSGTAPNVTYTPGTGYHGSDSFTFKANDGHLDSNIATVSITVVAVNHPPVANAQSVSTNEDTAKGITLTASDADGNTLTYSVVTGPAHGGLSGTAPNVTYTPAANYNGPDSFTFKANDGTADSNTATVSITVTPVNDPPVADAQSVSTNEDTAKGITLTASDVDGDALTFSVVTGPMHGMLSGTAPNVTYTPAGNYNGADSFTFKANDGAADSNMATVSITVTAVNDPPVANAQSVTTNQDTAKAITLTASDVDGDTLSFSVVTGPAHGSLSGTAPNLTYTPAAGYSGTDSFTFKANDGAADSNTATVSITVTAASGPQIVVEEPEGTGLVDGVSVVNLGEVVKGKSTSVTFTIRNTGTANLTGISLTLSGPNAKDFKVALPPRTSVLPGATTNFAIRLNPKHIGACTAALHIASSDVNENPFDIGLSGSSVKKQKKHH